ncbi:hypothetical protein LCGC14_0579170 [marine sediment metagenome]|uniref:Uncharacterized protein n=1 Tax=marine sediment metagenome TaxID=412755 RepID=A0A0F9UQA4_9ZZZZ
MITEIKKLESKYREISKYSEYVNVAEVLCDLHRLEQDARIKRIPKNQR